MFKQSELKLPDYETNLDETDGKHIYKRNGFIVPSVSEIIAPISNTIYGFMQGNRSETLENAAYRGTMVHLAINIYNLTGKESIAEPFKPYMEAYKRFIEEYQGKYRLIANEGIVWHRAFNYAGTLDLLFENIKNPNEIILVDTKTTAQLYEVILQPQLTLYKDAIKDDFAGKTIVQKCLWLKANGKFELIDIADYPYAMNLILQHNYIREHIKNINFNEIERL